MLRYMQDIAAIGNIDYIYFINRSNYNDRYVHKIYGMVDDAATKYATGRVRT